MLMCIISIFIFFMWSLAFDRTI